MASNKNAGVKVPGECTVCGGQNGNHSSWCGHGK